MRWWGCLKNRTPKGGCSTNLIRTRPRWTRHSLSYRVFHSAGWLGQRGVNCYSLLYSLLGPYESLGKKAELKYMENQHKIKIFRDNCDSQNEINIFNYSFNKYGKNQTLRFFTKIGKINLQKQPCISYDFTEISVDSMLNCYIGHKNTT